MVRWVNARNFGSPIAGAIAQYANAAYGDTLTPALKREQLSKLRRENQGAEDFQTTIRDWGASASAAPQAANTAASGQGPWSGLEDVQRGIFDGESNGDYDALFGFSNRENGLFNNVRLTGMTVDEAIRFSDPSGPYGQWVKGEVGHVATPMGAYQIVGSTLRDAKSALGLTGSEQLTPEMQDTLGRWVLDTQGTGAWEGYRGPNHGFTGQPLPSAAPSPLVDQPDTRPGRYNPQNGPQLFAELLARGVAGGMKPEEVGEAARMMAANLYGAENQATTNAFVGAGGNYANTYSGFAADQNRLERDSVRDAQLDIVQDENAIIDVVREGTPIRIRKKDMISGDQPVLSSSEAQAVTAGSLDLSRNEQLAFIGAEPKNPVKADTFVDPQGQTYRSVDGITDAQTGLSLPQGAVKTSVTSQDRAGSGVDLESSVVSGLQESVIAQEAFAGTLNRTRQAAIDAGPEGFGVVGRARSLGQGAVEAFRALGGMISDDTVSEGFESVRKFADSGDPVAKQFFAEFDTNLTRLEMYARLLPYEAAAAIANQTGRGLSDQDVKRFQEIIGGPLNFFGSQKGFLATLDAVEREVQDRVATTRRVLGQEPVGSPTPEIPEVPDFSKMTDEELDAYILQMEGGQ
ncbi:MAG: hypothetical protein AAGF53_02350 [Pseudomonadota bacterium]